MYSKEELQAKSVVQLKDIAKELGVKVKKSDNKETIVYAILDAQAEQPAPEAAPKRKRTRIATKKEDRVYSVHGNEGENFDVQKNQVLGPNGGETAPQAMSETAPAPAVEEEIQFSPAEQSLQSAAQKQTLNQSGEDIEAQVLANFPKHRGRRSKAELEAIAEARAAAIRKHQAVKAELEAQMAKDAQETANQQAATEAEQPEEATADNQQAAPEQVAVPEEQFSAGNAESANISGDLQAMLQAKMNAQNAAAPAPAAAPVPVEEAKEKATEKTATDKKQESAPINYTEGMKVELDADGTWKGDPGDGTDFILVVDIPIEDQAAIPTVDIFDRPTTPQTSHQHTPAAAPAAKNKQEAPAYDFSNLVKSNGVLEVISEGYGFLRSSDYNYLSSPDDVYVASSFVKKFGLKTGDVIECKVRPPHEGEKYFPLTSIIKINGRDPSEVRDRVPFEHLTPLFPDEKFNLCGDRRTTNLSTRIVDLFSPIGKGQRALIVAQPKTGKTILMKDIANAIAANHPEAYLMMLLIDERPEEVTDMARTVNAEVIASTFDEPAERHVKIAGIVLEKAKRMVECGHDVVIFLDSITRLARAYNTTAPASGKVLTGGVDANALQKPKRFFGAARNIEGGGSLTIIATALTDTGSKMDEVIFEEFKGTGNMELQLDRSLSNKRIFPAVNLISSSTRRDDLLQDKTTLDRMWILRKYLSDMNSIEAMSTIHKNMQHTRNNDEFLLSMNS
ncbi:transcription termination factor Rho [Segatella copri]|uniref:transcription termination factor Rho n=1 Tax=Segatella copri TaxID=165179 RepID=UPI002FF17D07